MLRPFTIKSQCVADDATLYAHITANSARGLPVLPQYAEHDGTVVLVGSGPSVADHVEAIRAAQQAGGYVVAIKDAHDWLLAHEIVPQAAVAIDPQAERAQVFHTPHPTVQYYLASQVHPAMLDHLAGYQVSLWHAYVRKDQAIPTPGTPLISGGTTTGLRAITLLYSMGFRTFELYGYDSCLQDGRLRMNGDRPRPGDDTINEIVVAGQAFLCNPSMTAQASEFQNLFWSMPDITISSHGHGLITAILEARANRPLRTVSFLHPHGPQWASYRYRCQIPADELGASINDQSADVLVLAKPEALTVLEMKQRLGEGKSIIIDFCDDHFDRPHYQDLLRLADAVTCSTAVLAETIRMRGREATVIPDPYEYPEAEPHCHGANVLYFGSPVNGEGLARLLPLANSFPLTVVTSKASIQGSSMARFVEWSPQAMAEEFAKADIVAIPATAPYKSCNRAVESIRQGCFVVAEPHPSLKDIPGIWIGNLEEGIEWAIQYQCKANQRTRHSQTYVSQRYSPKTVAVAWSRVIQACPSTWGQAPATGQDGSMSICREPASVGT